MTRPWPHSLNYYNAPIAREPAWMAIAPGHAGPVGAMLPGTPAFPAMPEAGAPTAEEAQAALREMPVSLRSLIECVGARLGFGPPPPQADAIAWVAWAEHVATTVVQRVPQTEMMAAWRSIPDETATLAQACDRLVQLYTGGAPVVVDQSAPPTSPPPADTSSGGVSGWLVIGGGLALAALAGLVIAARKKPKRRRNPPRRSSRGRYVYA